MGRGNVCTRGDYEGLYFVDYDNYTCEFETEDGEIITDYNQFHADVEGDMIEFANEFIEKHKSFTKINKYLKNDGRAILENNLFYIVLEDNEWSLAVKLIQKEQGYYDRGNILNLQKKHYENYLKSIKEVLFMFFPELGTYSGAWSSGKIKKNEVA